MSQQRGHIYNYQSEKEVPEGKTLFITDDPFEAYLKIVNHFRPFIASEKMISDSSKLEKIRS